MRAFVPILFENARLLRESERVETAIHAPGPVSRNHGGGHPDRQTANDDDSPDQSRDLSSAGRDRPPEICPPERP